MWQPNRRQWIVIWPLALLLVAAWPPDTGRSLLVKAINRAADPFNRLPQLPASLPMGLDDDGDAVAAHDALEAEYYHARDRSWLMRERLDWKDAVDPFDPVTERQILVGLGVFGALLIWKFDDR